MLNLKIGNLFVTHYNYTNINIPLKIAAPAAPTTPSSSLNKLLAAVQMLADMATLKKIKSLLFYKGYTDIIGVVTESYMTYRLTDGLGISLPDCILCTAVGAGSAGSAALVQYDSYSSLTHELGHLYTLTHRLPEEDEQKYSEAYNNYNLDPAWEMPRGKLAPKFSLMREGYGEPLFDRKDSWFFPDEYIRMFTLSNFLSTYEEKRSNSNLRIEGVFMPEGGFKILNTYLNRDVATPVSLSGEYLVELKDFAKNHISTAAYNTSNMSESEISSLSVNIDLPPHAVFVEIYKSESNSKRFLINSIVIPAAILQEEIKYIPVSSIKNDPIAFNNEILSLITKYKNYLQSGEFKSAETVLNKEILEYINVNMSDSLEDSFDIYANKVKMKDISMQSLIRLKSSNGLSVTSANSFVELISNSANIAGEKSSILINVIKKPSNKEYKVVYRAWFDGTKMNVVPHGKGFKADSTRLGIGNHSWSVQAYLVKTREDVALSKAYNSIYADTIELRKKLEIENDPEEIQYINKKIMQNENIMGKINLKKDALLMPLDSSVNLNFEVL